jgi:uncharacterized membrane protein YciS (DUF1049 family)
VGNAPQSYENHARLVPMYHFVSFGLIAVYVLWSLYVVVTAFSLASLMSLLFSVGVIIAMFFARVFPLGVQDRVIRLEEKLRLERLLGLERRDAISGMDAELLIGLRFASDGEVSDLFNAIVTEDITDRDEVKKRVTSWRADHQRI